MTTSRDVLASSPDICPGQISWDYDRAEIIADGVVHAIGVCLGLIGVTIVVIAVNIERIGIAPILGEGLDQANTPDQESNREDPSQSHPETPYNFD